MITVGESRTAAIPKMDFLTFPVMWYRIRNTAQAAR